MRDWKTALGLGALAATLSVGAFSAWGQSDPAKLRGAQALPANRIVGPGRIEPATGEIDLAAEIPGVIAEVFVAEGDKVRRGQILAELANRDLKAKVEQARAALRIKELNLAKMEGGPRPEERRQAAATLQELDANLNLLQKKLGREKSLFGKGFAASDTLDEAQSAHAQAVARRTAAAQSLALLEAGPRAEDMDAARAEVALAKAQLEEAEAALEKSRIRASVEGVVLRVYKQRGEAVVSQPATPVIQIGDLAHLVVRVQVDEADIAQLKLGQRAQIVAPAYPGQMFQGAISRLSPRLGTKTIVTGTPAEKHDSRVLDAMVALAEGTDLPVGLRVDTYIGVEK